MSYKKLILLASCHGLEDFPLYHVGEDAGSLLACWTSLWHPLLLHSAGELPRIERCEYPPEEIEDSLLLVPTPCDAELDHDLPAAAEQKNATLIRGLHKRSEILSQAIAPFGDAAKSLDEELVRDFLAFGFVYLQVEVLTQQMRYSSSIDLSRIERTIKAAAQAAVEQNADLCREHLTSAHDALTDERNHYYPVDVYLLDLTMVAPTASTYGSAFEAQLHDETPQNILASGATIEALAKANPTALQLLRDGIDAGRISLAGGEFDDQPPCLSSYNQIIDNVSLGLATYQQHLGTRPNTFGRRTSGIFPGLGRVARLMGFASMLHFKFDEGKYPESANGKTNWALDDTTALPCYAKTPLDASLYETYLNFPSSLSDAMDTEHVATRVFLHWPGHVPPYYGDMRRAARYGNAMGKWVTLDEYFAESGDAGASDTFSANDYRYPFLQQAVDREDAAPVSKWAQRWKQEADAISQQATKSFAGLLSGKLAADNDDSHDNDASEVRSSLQNALGKPDENACTILNPMSFPRRIRLTNDECPQQATGDAVYATAQATDGTCSSLVDVPAMGFVRVRFDGTATETSGPDLIEELTLRNEFMEAMVDETTGALRSLKSYKARRTQLSQQVAFRISLPKTGQHWVDRQLPVAYSVMAADSVEVTRNGKIEGEITAQGRMLAPNGEQVGAFTQRYQITRGSRVLVIESEIEIDDELLLEEAWDSYYAFRFAFGDETAVLRTGANLQMHETSHRQVQAPLFVDIDSGSHHMTVLSGGLPHHRRVNDTQLDTILAVKGEQARQFRIGIGVDLPAITRTALDFLATDSHSVLPCAAVHESGWLFHFDAKNVLAIHWQPLDNAQGFRVRVIETEQRASRVRLRAFKPIRSARLVNALGDELQPATVNEDGAVEFSVAAHDVLELECNF